MASSSTRSAGESHGRSQTPASDLAEVEDSPRALSGWTAKEMFL